MIPAQMLNRRMLLQATTLGLGSLALPRLTSLAQTPGPVDEITIDLSSEPASLAPSQVYEVNGWSVVHSIFDAPFEYDANGQMVMVAAESLSQVDDTTFEIKLRPGITFHDGTALTSQSLVASYQQIVNPDTGSSIAGNFSTITAVDAVDDVTVRISLNAPSPWLPAQIAVWMLCLSPNATTASDTSEKPVGTGPYSFVEWKRGESITLAANPNYNNPAKGTPIANRVVFRFVTEAATRDADLQSGTAQIVRAVPPDQIKQVEDSGAQVMQVPLSCVAFVRIATDVKPFDDVRVRQAINYAVDVDAIREALLAGTGRRLPNLYVPGGMGYDESLAPYSYDPDKAKSLLSEAGVSGLSTTIAATNSERKDLVEAIAGYLSDAGIATTVEIQEVATFNGQWTDASAPPLRYATWRPMFDPFNLLNLVFSEKGFLSRHKNPDIQALIDQAAVATDPATRAGLYQQLGKVMFDQPAALYLWDVTALYGTAAGLNWSPRPDDAIVPTLR
jgi:peptide/nickel transport system substrate-binding protein